MILYYSVLRKNPKDATAVNYYPCQKTKSFVTESEIAKTIEGRCTLRYSDVLACLQELEDIVGENLVQGNAVRLSRLGTFHTSLHSKAAATAKAADYTNIKKVRVRFVRSSTLANKVSLANKDISFKRINKDGSDYKEA